jgi:hypothetical protein
VKLGENANDICSKLCEAYGGEAVKKSRVFEWHKWFMMKEVVVQGLTKPMKMLKECRIWHILIDV